ncbi:MAG: glycosyltransferase family 2 protein [Oscillospiraceae bacterium]|nr:glycosyltransferase family 2 protein [Oscillospiraceae bacterium]
MSETINCTESCVIVLPSLNPDRKFDRVVDSLRAAGFRKIMIVDDGSDTEHQVHFERAESFPECAVLHHSRNKGKGRALKDGFVEVMKRFPKAEGVITIDGDGQHLTQDIILCGNRMLEEDKIVLGCRNFDLPGVPARSVAGNKTTSRMFRLYGIRLSDTQTGLRAIPKRYLSRFCAIEGERFEYETNMLLKMKRRGIPFVEQEIETVYEDENAGSHYDTVKDSWRIFKIMAKDLVRRS